MAEIDRSAAVRNALKVPNGERVGLAQPLSR